MAVNEHPPVPPHDFPPARTVVVPDRGEFFLRDSDPSDADPSRPVVFMLHGWVASADLNFGGLYDDVIAAGYRVIAVDHRGHGRGPRPLVPFRLADCAADAAAVIRTLGVAPALVYGYSMGGAIAQLIVRDHPDVAAGMVLSGTAQHWQEQELRRAWKAMPFVGFGLSVAPARGWRVALKRAGFRVGADMAWLHSEMTRHSAHDIAEAGRELGRFDSRQWLAPAPFPTAVVVTTTDEAVPPAKQRQLAAALGATVFEAPVRHLGVAAMAPQASAQRYNPVLIEALEALRAAQTSGSLAANES
ncbi:MAG: alpha/beta fold hydrolase [Acidobacteriota bacterium]|nr:alpha/beta fold hydrolase [Acidobacteriota bacterium]